jgi:hypothetical protein
MPNYSGNVRRGPDKVPRQPRKSQRPKAVLPGAKICFRISAENARILEQYMKHEMKGSTRSEVINTIINMYKEG